MNVHDALQSSSIDFLFQIYHEIKIPQKQYYEILDYEKLCKRNRLFNCVFYDFYDFVL